MAGVEQQHSVGEQLLLAQPVSLFLGFHEGT
jgi:hypothetical protein